MHNTDQSESPPKCALPPRNQPCKDTGKANRLCRRRREEDPLRIARKRTTHHHIPQTLQRKAPLSPGSTENHLLIYLQPTRTLTLHESREKQRIEPQRQGQRKPNKQITNNNDGDLLARTELRILADDASARGGRQRRDEGELRGRHEASDAGGTVLRDHVGNPDGRAGGEEDVDPPEHVIEGPKAMTPIPDHRERNHLNDRRKRDARARETGQLVRVRC